MDAPLVLRLRAEEREPRLFPYCIDDGKRALARRPGIRHVFAVTLDPKRIEGGEVAEWRVWDADADIAGW